MFGFRSWHFVAGLSVAAPFLLPYLQGQFSLAEPSEVGVGRCRGWGQALGGGGEQQTILLAAPNWISCNCTLRNLRHHLCGNNVPWNNRRWPQVLIGCTRGSSPVAALKCHLEKPSRWKGHAASVTPRPAELFPSCICGGSAPAPPKHWGRDFACYSVSQESLRLLLLHLT